MTKSMSVTPPAVGGVFHSRAIVVDPDRLTRSLRRIAHEIVEHTEQINDLIFVGIQRGGVPIAKQLASELESITNIKIPVNTIDVTRFRDDSQPVEELTVTDSKTPIENRIVVLVDDVLHTGRTIRAALDSLVTLGRPRRVELAVVVDRGHREMPIRADYVVKNIPTRQSEHIRVSLAAGVEIGVLDRNAVENPIIIQGEK